MMWEIKKIENRLFGEPLLGGGPPLEIDTLPINPTARSLLESGILVTDDPVMASKSRMPIMRQTSYFPTDLEDRLSYHPPPIYSLSEIMGSTVLYPTSGIMDGRDLLRRRDRLLW